MRGATILNSLISCKLKPHNILDIRTMDFLLRNLLTRPPFSYLYAISPPHKKRDRPMLVLALGLSRCGTESLKFALEELGYQGVYHGFETTGSHAVGWCRLLDLKYSGKGSEIKKEDFDQIIGDYEAVTDAPANMLAEEIMRAYPDAKVGVLSSKEIRWHLVTNPKS